MRCCIEAREMGNGKREKVRWSDFIKVSTLFTFYLLTFPCLTGACPLCKDALGQGLARGFYWSILLMLGVPLLIVAVFVGIIFTAYRKPRLPAGQAGLPAGQAGLPTGTTPS